VTSTLVDGKTLDFMCEQLLLCRSMALAKALRGGTATTQTNRTSHQTNPDEYHQA
jgi:hypothetical protein